MVDPEPMTDGFNREQKDWAGSLGKFALAWGIPIGALVVASVLGPFAKTVAGPPPLFGWALPAWRMPGVVGVRIATSPARSS